ncbi:hypothetical protein DL98DRAFT_581993 [Cadophora sp. DSE1049]|nr:hypothetical protein DL98DRAFT_581993 [Cadophora sp. DSE1049]
MSPEEFSHTDFLGMMKSPDKIANRLWKHRQDDPADAEKEYGTQEELPAAVSSRNSATVEAFNTRAEREKTNIKCLTVVQGNQFVLRLFAIVNAFLSLYLILSSVVAFRLAQHKPGRPLLSIQGSGNISALPWTVFGSIAGANIVVNFFFLIIFCCMPKKAGFPIDLRSLLTRLTLVTVTKHSRLVLQYH